MKKLIKSILKPIFSRYKNILKRLDNLEMTINYLVKDSEYIQIDDRAFNGQVHRQKIFLDLINSIVFDAIVETGTFDGSTSGYMALTSKKPVYTCELNQSIYDIARMRLRKISNINYFLGDSRNFLKKLVDSEIKRVLFYLDSHWNDDLPLKEELKIISNNWKDFVIIVDDFKVPGDEGYLYDDYGQEKSLTMSVFEKEFADNGLSCFFPSLDSIDETGAKRGCTVLCKNGKMSEVLSLLESLNSYKIQY